VTLRRLPLVLALAVVASLLANPAGAICKNCSYNVYGCSADATQNGYTSCVSYQDSSGNWTCNLGADCTSSVGKGNDCVTVPETTTCWVTTGTDGFGNPVSFQTCTTTPSETICGLGGGGGNLCYPFGGNMCYFKY
jgi:hypothetical protein